MSHVALISFSQFIAKYAGKKIDWDNAYQGQCVDLFRQYNHEVLGIPQPKGVVGAADFWANYTTDPVLNTHFTKIVNTPEFIPQKGDVMVWNKRAGGGFGHIAVVVTANIDSFTSFDQNWRALNVCELTKHDYTNVYGVLRPKVQSIPKPMPENYYKGIDLSNTESVKVCVDVWADVRDGKYVPKAEIDGKNAVIEQLKTDLSNATSKENQFLETLANKLGTIVDRGEIVGSVDRLISRESELVQEIKNTEKSFSSTIASLEEEIREKEEIINSLRKEFEEEKLRFAALEKKFNRVQAEMNRKKEEKNQVNLFQKHLENFLEKIKNIGIK